MDNKDKNDNHNTRGEVKMVFRCMMRKNKKGFQAECLELSIVAEASTINGCHMRLNQAIDAYLQVIRENSNDKFEFRPVPFYHIRKIWFDFCFKKRTALKTQKTEKFTLERMMPIGI